LHFGNLHLFQATSLVPRPKEEEKGPGFSHSHMRIVSDLTTCW